MNLTFPLGRAVYKTVDSVGPSTVSWGGGTAPTGTTTMTCKAQYVGNGFMQVELKIWYATAGVNNTGMGFDWPADLPSPAYMSGITGSQAIAGMGSAWIHTVTAYGGANPTRCEVVIKRNGPDTAWGGNLGSFSAINTKFVIIQMLVQIA